MKPRRDGLPWDQLPERPGLVRFGTAPSRARRGSVGAGGGCRDPFGEADAPDNISGLGTQTGTLRDAIADLKERLTNTRSIDVAEPGLLKLLTGFDPATPLTELLDADASLRRVCVALLRSPLVQLQGLEPSD